MEEKRWCLRWRAPAPCRLVETAGWRASGWLGQEGRCGALTRSLCLRGGSCPGSREPLGYAWYFFLARTRSLALMREPRERSCCWKPLADRRPVSCPWSRPVREMPQADPLPVATLFPWLQVPEPDPRDCRAVAAVLGRYRLHASRPSEYPTVRRVVREATQGSVCNLELHTRERPPPRYDSRWRRETAWREGGDSRSAEDGFQHEGGATQDPRTQSPGSTRRARRSASRRS